MSYCFGPFELDTADRLLRCRGELVPLTPKALDTLLLLVEQHGHVVTKHELLERIWPDSFVEQNNLAQNISLLRKTLGEQTAGGAYIDTVPKRGYRFVAPVSRREGELARAAGAGGGGSTALAGAPSMGMPSAIRPAAAMPAMGMPAPGTAPAFTVPETRYARSGDVNVAYQVIGEGPFDLVFVMGWVSHLECFWTEPSFARFLRRLASFSRVIIFDKRGTGLSDRISAMPTLEQRMDDVRAVMEAAGSSRAVLLGVSEGGPMCSLFAATYPEKTLALVMIGTYARRLRAPDYPWGPTPEEHERFYEQIQREWGGPVGLEERAPSRQHDSQFRDWWAAYLRMSASPGAALTLTKMNAAIDVRDVLPSVRVPTLILHRAGDRLMQPAEARYIAGRIPGARYVEVPGDDHLPFVGNQDALLNEIDAFVTRLHDGLDQDRDRLLATVLYGVMDVDGPAAVFAERQARLLDFATRDIERHRGRLAPSSSSTDAPAGARSALLATFDGPARAVRCGAAIAEAARRLDLPLRIGAHTGECTLSDSAVHGPAVDIAQRVAEQATPPDLLVSRTVRDLVAGSGLRFRDCGLFLRPGAEGELPLFCVEPAPLPATSAIS
jgi:pimeloyl-ACP methyl ester carboxylesterase/DNA-binding winged helix-turn-helix (wHTH) protein